MRPAVDSIPCDKLQRDALTEFLRQPPFPKKNKPSIAMWQKIRNEKKIKKLLTKLMDEMQPLMNEMKARDTLPLSDDPSDLYLKQQVKDLISNTLIEIDDKKLLFDESFLGYFIAQGYLDVAEEFISRARLEDSGLNKDELFQALRNVWIMNSLQLMWDLPLELTDPIYAYSMLYPYTDNILDDPTTSYQEKEQFNYRLSQSLAGRKTRCKTARECRIFQLVSQIHQTYPLKTVPQVTESIQLIQKAQIQSLKQTGDRILSKEECLSVSFFKGGTSVLADAFLIKSDLDYEQMLFAYQYGAFLQLLDDLQDKEADEEIACQTLFSSISKQELADPEIISLIVYIYTVNEASADDSETTRLMKNVIRQCTIMMIMETVGRHPQVVSRDFYKQLEACSKVRLSFYKELHATLSAFVESSPWSVHEV